MNFHDLHFFLKKVRNVLYSLRFYILKRNKNVLIVVPQGSNLDFN